MLAFEHHVNTSQRLITSVWFIVFLTNISAIVALMGLPVWMLVAAVITACGYTIVLFENAHVNTKLADEAMKDIEQRKKLETVANRADKTIKFAAIVGLSSSGIWLALGFLMLVGFPLLVNYVEMQRPYFLSPTAAIVISGIFYFYALERAKLAENVKSN